MERGYFSTNGLTPEQSTGVSAIEALDLEPIRFKLVDKKEGRGWSRAKAEEVERSYKQFLFLKLKYPETSIVPNKTVDEFWHQHILDTKKYADDSQRIFGFFLHHFPYFGMRGEEDAAELERCFKLTKELLAVEFGKVLVPLSSPSNCDSSACESQPNCGSSCTGKGEPAHPEVRPRFKNELAKV